MSVRVGGEFAAQTQQTDLARSLDRKHALVVGHSRVRLVAMMLRYVCRPPNVQSKSAQIEYVRCCRRAAAECVDCVCYGGRDYLTSAVAASACNPSFDWPKHTTLSHCMRDVCLQWEPPELAKH